MGKIWCALVEGDFKLVCLRLKVFSYRQLSPLVLKIVKTSLVKWSCLIGGMMKQFIVRLSFTDRRQGPGVGRSISAEASNLPGAVSKATRTFWKSLTTKQRNDARRSGVKIDIREKAQLQEAPAEVYRMVDRAIAGRPA